MWDCECVSLCCNTYVNAMISSFSIIAVMTMIIDVVSKRGKTLEFSAADGEAKWFRTDLKKMRK